MPASHLISGNRKTQNLEGQRFGRLIAVRFSGFSVRCQNFSWICRCDCGKECIVRACNLRSGHTRSCGCLSQENKRSLHRVHGMNGTPEYIAWQKIIDRCGNPNNPFWNRYGGRGITMFQPWRHSFEEFFKHIGRKPSPKHSIDRINNDGNYEPGNVRWATPLQQSRNRGGRVFVEYRGEKLCISEWSQKVGIKLGTLLKRIRNGWPIEKAMTTTVR